MKTSVSKLNFIAVVVMFLGMGFGSQVFGQTTTWKYEAGDNSGGLIQITTDGSGYVTKVNLATKGATNWTTTTIQSVDDYQEYIRVKSNGSGRVYELHVYWDYDKVVMVLPEGNEITYWLKN